MIMNSPSNPLTTPLNHLQYGTAQCEQGGEVKPLGGFEKKSEQQLKEDGNILKFLLGSQSLSLIFSTLSFVGAHTSTEIYWMKYSVHEDGQFIGKTGLDVGNNSLWIAYTFTFFAFFVSICNFITFVCLERRVNGFIPKGVSHVIPGFKPAVVLTVLQFFFNMLAFSIALATVRSGILINTSANEYGYYDDLRTSKGRPGAGMVFSITVFLLSFVNFLLLIGKRKDFQTHKTTFEPFSAPNSSSSRSILPNTTSINNDLIQMLRKRVVDLEAEVETLSLKNTMERVDRLGGVVGSQRPGS